MSGRLWKSISRAPRFPRLRDWEESPQPAELFMTKLDKAAGLVEAKEHVYRKIMQGTLKNADVVV